MSGRKLGKATSGQLVSTTRLPRPTVLAALKSLRQFGLCEVSDKDGRSLFYVMLHAQALKPYLGQKVKDIESLIEDIDNLPEETEPTIHVQSGKDEQGLPDLLEYALRCKSRQWRIIAPRDNALRYLSDDYVAYFKRKREERQISAQTLWESKFSEQSISLIDTLMRKPRYLPKDFSQKIPAMILSFDESLLLIRGSRQPSASLITNKEIVATYNIIFDLAWRTCRGK